MLKTNAINAINALLEAQLMAVSRESGIDINILQKYVGDSSAPAPAPAIQEKKKRAPPKKKAPAPVQVPEVPTVVTEVPTVVTEVPSIEVPVVEKKKRAPPKKKVPASEQVDAVVVAKVELEEAPTIKLPKLDANLEYNEDNMVMRVIVRGYPYWYDENYNAYDERTKTLVGKYDPDLLDINMLDDDM